MAGLSNHFLEINGVHTPPQTTPESAGGSATGQAAQAPTSTEALLNTQTPLELQLGLPPVHQQPVAQIQINTQNETAVDDSVLPIGSLDPSDRKFYAMSPEEGALDRFDQSYTAQVSVEAINNATPVIVDSDKTKDERRYAVHTASAQVENLSQIENSLIRNAAFELIQPDLVVIGEGVDHLDGNGTTTVIGQLTRATENLGTDDGHLIANPVAHGLHVGTPRHLSNEQELSNAITKTIEDGDGALFAVLATEDLSYDPGLRNVVAVAAATGITTLNEAFNDARDKKESLENQISQYIFEFGDTLTAAELQNGIDAVVEANQTTLDEYEAAAAQLTTTFNGVSLLPVGEYMTATTDLRPQLWFAGGSVRSNLNDALNTDAGLELFGNAIEQSASGNGNFYTEFTDFFTSINFTSVNDTRDAANQFADITFKALVARADRLIRQDDFDGAARLFKGFESAAPLFNVNNPEKLSELTQLLENQTDSNTRLSAVRFSERFAEVSSDVEGRVFISDSSRAGRGFQVLGLAVGASALASDLTLKEIDRDLAFRSLVNASELSDDLASLLPEGRVSREFLENFGKLAKAGIIFDVVDIYTAFNNGDTAAVGLGITGLVGTILTTTSAGGPVGTAVGSVLSLLAVGGSVGLSHYRSNQAEDRAEEGLGTFLTGAGFTPEEAQLLRDVTGDTHQSIGRVFTQIAATHPDLEPRDVLEVLLDPGNHKATQLGGVPTSDGDIALIDHRQELINALENLERGPDGNFTQDSLHLAITLFETNLGVNLRADGLTTETALQQLEDDFAVFDRNGDGQVSNDELQQFAEPLNGAQGPLTSTQSEQQSLAQYLLHRETLLDRLDQGGNVDSQFGGNDKISQQDIDDVQEQNQHLAVIQENLELFDVAKNPDGIADGIISRTDLERVRDGDYPANLANAARFLLDNQDLFDFVDAGQQHASGQRFWSGDGYGNGPFVDGRLSQADVHDAWLTLNG